MTLDELARQETSRRKLNYLINPEAAYQLGFKRALKLASERVDASIEVISNEAEAALGSRLISVNNPDHFEVGISRGSILGIAKAKDL